MAKAQSAGILLYKLENGDLKVLIAHPGGPFFAKKDESIWSIPKGLYEDDEKPLDAAKREYEEEIGIPLPGGPFIDIGEIERKDKIIKAWAVEGDVDERAVHSNTFEMEWPPRSGKKQEFPEIDRAQWFDIQTAAKKLQPTQVPFLERLAEHLKIGFTPQQEPQQNSLF